MASMNSGSQRGPPRSRGGRHNTRGGIQKSGQTHVRTDRDGDVDMDGPARGRAAPRGPRTSSTGPGRAAPREDGRKTTRPARNPFATVKRALNQQDAPAAKASGAARFAAAMEQASTRFDQPKDRPRRDEVLVRGWSKSKAASNPGGCQSQLVDFLQRKASNISNDKGEKTDVRISKSHVNGDTLTVSVHPGFVPLLVALDGFIFAGAPLSIKEAKGDGKGSRREKTDEQPKKEASLSETGRELKDRIKSMLDRRYSAETKLLDLSSLGTDPEFANSGIFDSTSTQSKFFPALMKVCGDAATSAAEKREMITSVALNNNALPDVTTVTTLAQTFPDIKNLDLSNNNFQDLKALEPWRRKFRSLDLLVLTGNPIETAMPTYYEEITKWFPTLRILNGVQVRTDEQVAAAANRKPAISIARPCFEDEAGIGEKFLTFFFPAYDSDRAGLAASFYDAQATFTYSVNVSAKRLEGKTADWNQYIKGSRNMMKITSFPGRKQRTSRGTDAIREMWARLPPTRHPDLGTESDKWCIECHPIAGLPDPSAATQGGIGIGGLIIYVHGEFGEVDVSTMQTPTRRSFDRTFVLGPGAGLGGIRVISDMLVVRAYGGHDAFKPTDDSLVSGSFTATPASAPVPHVTVSPPLPVEAAAAHPQQQPIIPPGLVVPPAFAAPAPGKPEEQLLKERIALEFCSRLRLTLDYASMCLEQNEWNLEMAGVAFQEARANLPPEAFF